MSDDQRDLLSDKREITNYGGHAIMVAVEVGETVLEIARNWVSEKPESRKMKDETHVTVVFVGRDLPEFFGERMQFAVDRVLMEDDEKFSLPETLSLEKFDMFGKNKDHLVATIGDSNLPLIRAKLTQALRQAQVFPSVSYSTFRPHVTVAIGEGNDTAPQRWTGDQSIKTEDYVLKIGKRYETI